MKENVVVCYKMSQVIFPHGFHSFGHFSFFLSVCYCHRIQLNITISESSAELLKKNTFENSRFENILLTNRIQIL